MRTTIDIDDALLETAMRAGPFRTKKDAVEAGLKLLARRAAYREILKWRGKLHWDGDDSVDWTQRGAESVQPILAMEPPSAAEAPWPATTVDIAPSVDPATKTSRSRRAGR